MASIVSKLARAAALACRACPATVVGGVSRRAVMAPRLYPIGWRRICSAVSPAKNMLERDDPKSSTAGAAAAVKMDPVIISSGKNTSEKDGPRSLCSEEETPVQVRRTDQRKTKDPSQNLNMDTRSLESGEALWALYEYWCKHHGRERTRAEMKRRFKWFKKSPERVHKANSGGGRPICKLSQFSDLRPMEMPTNIVLSRRLSTSRLFLRRN